MVWLFIDYVTGNSYVKKNKWWICFRSYFHDGANNCLKNVRTLSLPSSQLPYIHMTVILFIANVLVLSIFWMVL